MQVENFNQARIDFNDRDSLGKKRSIKEEDPFYSETNLKYLRESISELEKKRGKVRELIDD